MKDYLERFVASWEWWATSFSWNLWPNRPILTVSSESKPCFRQRTSLQTHQEWHCTWHLGDAIDSAKNMFSLHKHFVWDWCGYGLVLLWQTLLLQFAFLLVSWSAWLRFPNMCDGHMPCFLLGFYLIAMDRLLTTAIVNVFTSLDHLFPTMYRSLPFRNFFVFFEGGLSGGSTKRHPYMPLMGIFKLISFHSNTKPSLI